MSYPGINDSDFYEKIEKKFKKFKIPSKQKSMKEICFPKKYEFQIPQIFLSNFMNPESPYRGLLIFHKIGAGKTCAAINIAEKFKNVLKIVVVLPASLKGNFRSELRSPCAGNTYLTKKERNDLKHLHPSSEEYKKIIKISDSRIDHNYTIYSYNKFIDLIKNKQIKLDNTLLIIDEIHNMISESGTYYETLLNLLEKSSKNTRLVIMSATPIFDKPAEIGLTMNLLLKDKKLPVSTDFNNLFIHTKITEKGPVYKSKNMDIFKNHIQGIVSYYRGAPPYVFPRSTIKIVRCRMSNKQLRLYKKIIKYEKRDDVSDYINSNISNSFFIGTRMVSNICYPNNKLGNSGFDSLTDYDLKYDKLKIYSPKFFKILRKIKRCNGTMFIYSNFKEHGGIKVFTKMLDVNGFKNYETDGEGKNRYAVWSGDQDHSFKEEIKAVFNNINNVNGEKIKLILGSPSIKEGVSLLRVRQVHVIEPYWNMSRLDQIIGRAIRFCSHKDVPPDDRQVDVFIYLAVHPDLKMSIDQKIMRMAIKKREINNEFEQALKEMAVDCRLFKNANVYRGEEDIVCH